LCAHGTRCPSLASDRCRAAVCSLRLHKTLIPLSPSCKVNVQVARCARCALIVLDALLWRQATAAAVLSPSTSDVYTAHPPSCRAISLVEMRCWRSRCLKTFFRSWTVLPLCSRRPHRTFIPLLPSCNDQSSRDALVVRSWFLMPFFGVRPPPLLCSRRPHRTFVPRSRHLHVEMRLMRSWFSMPSLAPDRRRRCALVLSPSTLDVCSALAIVQGDRTSRDALLLRSWFSMPFFGVGTPPLL
jgi:hypothetical protein